MLQDSKQAIAERIKSFLAERLTDVHQASSSRLYLTVDRADIRDVVVGLFNEPGGRLATISCVDTRAGMEMLYHLVFGTTDLVCTVRTLLPKPHPEVESVAPQIPGAEWIEREIGELFGVTFPGNPNPNHLVLSDDWPEDSYPLRREQS